MYTTQPQRNGGELTRERGLKSEVNVTIHADVNVNAIDAQIAALQAEKAHIETMARREARRAEEKEREVLVRSTPSKKVKRDNPITETSTLLSTPTPTSPTLQRKQTRLRQSLPSLTPSQAGPSNMSRSLAALRRNKDPSSATPTSDSGLARPLVPRSSSFSDRVIRKPASERTTDRRQRHPPGPSTSAASSKAGIRRLDQELDIVDMDREGGGDGDEGGKRGGGWHGSHLRNDRAPERDEDSLAIVEKLKPGPKTFGKDPEGEDVWAFVEPNSGIRLSKRVLEHTALQDHLSGRYFLPPSLLYSVIRLSRDGATYDVPVEGDWLTIAVVAERGEVKVSGTKEDVSDTESEVENDDGDLEQGSSALESRSKLSALSKSKSETDPKSKSKSKSNSKFKPKPKKRAPRKYINLKLASLPPRRAGRESTSTQGDALLQLLLFEADAIVRSEPNHDEHGKGQKTRSYRGGSGGAYEKWCNLGVGSVIAILNPRVLRPLRAGGNTPHPLTLPLALNPTSADSVSLIGQSRDLGCCSAQQKDGSRCRTWVDLRQSQVCEYHVHAAVQRSRNARAEFTASTSSFALSASSSSSGHAGSGSGSGTGSVIRGGTSGGARPTANFRINTGLLPGNGPRAAPRGPDNGGGGATYVIGSGLVRTGGNDFGGLKHFGDEHLADKLGRSRAQRRKRKVEEREAEEALVRLVDRGSMGGKYLAAAERYEAAKRSEESKGSKGSGLENSTGSKRSIVQTKQGKPGEREKRKSRSGQCGVEDESEMNPTSKRPFSAMAIKRIGFDPTQGQRADDGGDRERRGTISQLKESGREFEGTKKVVRRNVRPPPSPGTVPGREEVLEGDEMVDLD